MQDKNYVWWFISLVFFLLLWQIASNDFLPPPCSVAMSLIQLLFLGDDRHITLFHHSYASIIRVFLGVAMATIFALAISFLSRINTSVFKIICPIISFLRPIPPIAWIPIIVLLYGSGLKSQTLIVAIGAFFPIFTNTLYGLTHIPHQFTEFAKSFNLSKYQYIVYIFWPAALPHFLSGLKTGVGVGWMCIVASEMLGLKNAQGLGFAINYYFELGQMSNMIATMCVIGFIGIISHIFFSHLEKKFMWWRVVQ